MADVAFEKPVEDTVPKINDEVAVGEDLEFQRKWWRFERTIWVLFGLLLIATAAGLFGAGPLAHRKTSNSAMYVEYDAVDRAQTPAILRVSFQPGVIQNGKVQLFVSESMVKELGAQRIIPAPESSTVGGGGITYVFPATFEPATVAFALQPASPSVTHFTLQVPNQPAITERIITMP